MKRPTTTWRAMPWARWLRGTVGYALAIWVIWGVVTQVGALLHSPIWLVAGLVAVLALVVALIVGFRLASWRWAFSPPTATTASLAAYALYTDLTTSPSSSQPVADVVRPALASAGATLFVAALGIIAGRSLRAGDIETVGVVAALLLTLAGVGLMAAGIAASMGSLMVLGAGVVLLVVIFAIVFYGDWWDLWSPW